jgi:hypothetical protein
MNRTSRIKGMLLAGALAMAMTVAAAEAGAETIDFTGSLVLYTVPTTGVYDIIAYGAQGGDAVTFFGGKGAEAGGDIVLSAGTVLAVLAGGEGSSTLGIAGGGGGGSFVFEITDGSYLVVAGGGGGAGGAGIGLPGLTTTAGGAGGGEDGGSGGTGGSGGEPGGIGWRRRGWSGGA